MPLRPIPRPALGATVRDSKREGSHGWIRRLVVQKTRVQLTFSRRNRWIPKTGDTCFEVGGGIWGSVLSLFGDL